MVSIPAAAGKIHPDVPGAGAAAPFQFPQLRVRYINAHILAESDIGFQFPQLRVRYIVLGIQHRVGEYVSIPAAAGKIHVPPASRKTKPGVSIPAAAGKIHNVKSCTFQRFHVSIPAAAGKIHRKNNESTLHICGTICAAFCLCLLYYRGSLKPCLPFAQKAKRNFPVFVFSRVRSPVL